jgi:hypothetical protein
MPIRDPKPPIEVLPENVRAAFAERALLPLPAVAKLLGMHADTLRALADQGKISWSCKGLGRVRPRRMFGIDDVAGLWHTMRSSAVVAPTGALYGKDFLPHRKEHPAQKR